jgi:DNA-directed RNA polymerase
MELNKRWVFTIAALAFVFFVGACTPKPFLKVQYQLPAQSNTLAGEKVTLAVSDMRGKEAFLTESAEKSLKNFDKTFSLVVLRDDSSGNLIGVYDLVSLLSEVFQRRLTNAGVQVAAVTDNSLSELKIEITEFQLDFSARKWIVKMNYQASLSDNGNLLSKESISGEAERLKVRGKSDAEKNLSELLTDMVNKLNLERLFQQARK